MLYANCMIFWFCIEFETSNLKMRFLKHFFRDFDDLFSQLYM